MQSENFPATLERIRAALDLESSKEDADVEPGRLVLSVVTSLLKKDQKSLPLFMIRA